MGINLGTGFEEQVAQLAGFEPGQFTAGSVTIDFLNPSGPTTVLIQARLQLDTDDVRAAIQAAAQPTTTS